MKKLVLTATTLLGFAVASLQAQLPAFPGATGFGALATGGRGGTVYHVTNTNDSGAGSFREAVGTANRIVVFDVGGYISLASAVSCANNLTIAGQTAPGDGIGIMGHEVSFSVKSNEIVRFLRFRPGSIASSTEDGINVGDGTNMIFDHISIEFAPYNNVDATGSRTGGNQITIQNSILADPIGQQFTAHTEAVGNTFSWYGNIFSSAHNRNPLAKINTIFINNVVYNFQAGYTVANTSGNFSHDIINNYFITGPSTTSPSDDFYQMDSNQSIYSAGNLLDSDNNGALGGSAAAPSGVTVLSSPWSSLTPGIPQSSTASAFRRNISIAGAFPQDQVDQNVLADVTSLGTSGRMWTSQTSTGLGNNGYGVITGGTAPTDTDGDGMPDYWEKAMGLNPGSASDGSTTGADGYTHVEEYLNWLAGPHTTTTNTTAVDTDLSQYTGGFVSSPTFTVSAATHGTVSLNSDGHTAHFTPTSGFLGLGGYNFSVTDSAGATMTNSVAVLVQPGAPATPTGLFANAGNGQVTLGWNASSGATGYPVDRAPSSAGPYSPIALVTTTGYTNTGLTNGTTYFYTVAASNSVGVSAFSSYIGATPTGSGGLPSPWLMQDIGTVGTTGSATYTNGVFTVKGGGAGAWNTGDAFRFVYQTINSNNCTISGEITSLSLFQAGVMIRQSLATNSTYAHSKLHLAHPGRFEYRATTGASAILGGSTPANITAPYWFRVVRSGNTFTGYTSSNNVTWTQTATTNIVMTNPIYVGLSTASGTTNSLSTAVFQNVTVATP